MLYGSFSGGLSPPFGRRPGLPPDVTVHPAAPNTLFSVVGTASGYVDLTTGFPLIKSGSPVFDIDGAIGNSFSFSGTQVFNSATKPVLSPTSGTAAAAYTMGAIFRITSTPATTAVISVLDNVSGAAPSIYTAAALGLTVGAWTGTAVSGVTLVVGVPYFVAYVPIPQIGTGRLACVVKNLQTGQLFSSGVFVGTSGAGYTTGTTWGIGNLATRPFTGNVGAVMFSLTALTPRQLLQWSDDPWSFWYPPSLEQDYLYGTAAAAVTANVIRSLMLTGVGQ